MPQGCEIRTDSPLSTVQDNPKDKGTENFLSRAAQCLNITYATTSTLPAQKGDIEIGTQVKGVVYSSTREESLYVPNAVSFETYITALQDPYSYIYTRVSKVKNSKTYYGTVCSAFAGYCYDLPCIYTTNQLGKLDTMEKLEGQNIDDMQLGDMFLRANKHVRVIVGIERDGEGHVVNVTEAEAAPPYVRTKTWTRQGVLQDMRDNGYVIYRYSKLKDVPFEYSQWADPQHVPDALCLCPRRGNKSNWPYGETVEIDVTDPGDYGYIKLYKDGVMVDSSAIPSSLCMKYDGLESGKYEACLSNGKTKSESVSFIVVDTDVAVEMLNDGQIKIYHSSSNAIARWYGWCRSNEIMSSGTDDTDEAYDDRGLMAVVEAFEVTEEDRLQEYTIAKRKQGNWLLKVEFETEYGLISSRFVRLAGH